MRLLMEEESLKDTDVFFGSDVDEDLRAVVRPGRTSKRMSGCLLSLVSPVLHTMVCGTFKESLSKRLELVDIQEGSFMRVAGLACGEATMQVSNMGQLLELGKAADWLQLPDVLEALMVTACRSLSVDVCAEVLRASMEHGFVELEARSRCMALERFENVARTGGFLELDEECVGGLVDDDELAAECEEGVLEAVVTWMKGGGDGLRGEGLLRKVRYGLMGDEYLSGAAARVLGESEVLGELVSEAIRVKRAARERAGKVDMGQLGVRALVERRGKGVNWGRYKEGGERRLVGHAGGILALVECMGRVCIAAEDGSIRIWNKATLAEERVLEAAGKRSAWSLACLEGHLVSGHNDGRMRVWDIASGQCKQTVQLDQGWTAIVLGVCGKRLISGSDDESVRVWVVGDDMELRYEQTLWPLDGTTCCLAVWEGKVMVGSNDNGIHVWDVESGAGEATLEGHTDVVTALVVVADVRLISGSYDGTLRIWGLGTWLLLQTVEVYASDSHIELKHLAVSGSKLVIGSSSSAYGSKRSELKVWDLDSLKCEHTIPMPDNGWIFSLLGVRGEVWAGGVEGVMVWGRE